MYFASHCIYLDQIKKQDMDWSCRTHWEHKKYIQNFSLEIVNVCPYLDAHLVSMNRSEPSGSEGEG
jgi:hypothetical protein